MSDDWYFSSVEGRPFRMPGTDAYLGARKRYEGEGTKDDPRRIAGFEYDTARVYAIPPAQHVKYRKDYLNAERRGELKRRTKEEHEAQAPKPEPMVDDAPSAGPHEDEVQAAEAPKPKKTAARRGGRKVKG